RLAELVHEREVGLAEDERHVVHLLEPDAVLAGDGAADLGADLEDLAARLDHARFLAGNAWIVEDVRMQVAVARVEDVAHAKTVRRGYLVHPRQHLAKARARDDAIHDHVGGRDAAVGAKRALPPLPQELTLRLVARRAHLARAGVAAGGHHTLGLTLHAVLEPVELDEEGGGRISWIATTEGVFHGDDG